MVPQKVLPLLCVHALHAPDQIRLSPGSGSHIRSPDSLACLASNPTITTETSTSSASFAAWSSQTGVAMKPMP